MNDLGKYANIFDDLALWQGVVPHGYTADSLGTLTATNFLQGSNENGLKLSLLIYITWILMYICFGIDKMSDEMLGRLYPQISIDLLTV